MSSSNHTLVLILLRLLVVLFYAPIYVIPDLQVQQGILVANFLVIKECHAVRRIVGCMQSNALSCKAFLLLKSVFSKHKCNNFEVTTCYTLVAHEK